MVRDAIGKGGAKPEDLLKLANACLTQGDFDKAILFFDEVREIDSENPDAWIGKLNLLIKDLHSSNATPNQSDIVREICNTFMSCPSKAKSKLLDTMGSVYAYLVRHNAESLGESILEAIQST